MNTAKRASIVIVLLGILITVNALGEDSSSQKTNRRHHSPPPEAYTACEGKSAGDTAEFVTPNGDTVTGICVQEGDRLVLRPDRSNASSNGRRNSPPPEAYSACEGKNAGDTAQFVTPDGNTVTGTCVQEGDRLVLRPDHPKMDSGE